MFDIEFAKELFKARINEITKTIIARSKIKEQCLAILENEKDHLFPDEYKNKKDKIEGVFSLDAINLKLNIQLLRIFCD